MEKAVLKAEKRTVTGKQVGVLRRQGKLPGVLYGHHFEATPITMDLREATRLLSTLTGSSLINIELEGKTHAVLVREKQRDYLKNMLLHVDFQAVSLTEKLRTRVNIELVGVSPAVKDFNGVVVTGVDEIEVECLPTDLPERIIVDISKLANIGDNITVKDLVIPEKVEVHTHPEEMVVVVTQVAEEKEGEEVAAAEGEAEPEVIEKGKKEEEVEE